MTIEEIIRPRSLDLKLAIAFDLTIELKNVILVAFRSFAFLHSQGQSRHFGRVPFSSGLPQRTDIFRAVGIKWMQRASGPYLGCLSRPWRLPHNGGLLRTPQPRSSRPRSFDLIQIPASTGQNQTCVFAARQAYSISASARPSNARDCGWSTSAQSVSRA
jgi:hypothetical protein